MASARLIRFAAAVVLAAAPTQVQSPEVGGAVRFVVYYNSDASPASALIGLPYTHVILSFITARIGDDGSVENSHRNELLVMPSGKWPTLFPSTASPSETA